MVSFSSRVACSVTCNGGTDEVFGGLEIMINQIYISYGAAIGVARNTARHSLGDLMGFPGISDTAFEISTQSVELASMASNSALI